MRSPTSKKQESTDRFSPSSLYTKFASEHLLPIAKRGAGWCAAIALIYTVLNYTPQTKRSPNNQLAKIKMDKVYKEEGKRFFQFKGNGADIKIHVPEGTPGVWDKVKTGDTLLVPYTNTGKDKKIILNFKNATISN